MEPITALLTIIGGYGVNALVGALSGSDKLGEVSGELFRALSESESRMDARLRSIEDLLDQLLEQRYSVALGTGLRYFLDAASEEANQRVTDLDRARAAFIEATVAARSPLQQAVAERYILLSLLAQGRLDAAAASIIRVENAATVAAFDAMIMSELSRNAYEMLERGDPRYPSSDPRPPKEVKAAALESMAMCGRLLSEGAALAPALALPPRAAPPTEIGHDSGGVERERESFVVRTIYSIPGRKPDHIDPARLRGLGKPYWTFELRPGDILRVGSLTLELLPGETADKSAHLAPYVVKLRLGSPLQRQIVLSLAYPSVISLPSLPPPLPWSPTTAGVSPLVHPLGRIGTGGRLVDTGSWDTGFFPYAIEVPAGADKCELALPTTTPKESGVTQTIDTSRRGIRLNPAYITNNFIVASCVI